VSDLDSLAREVLRLLVYSGRLRPVVRDRVVAFETYHLPRRIVLRLPDEDRYSEFLNPWTRTDACAALARMILDIVANEERDGWILPTPVLDVDADLLETGAGPTAFPEYEPKDSASSRPPLPSGTDNTPLLRVLLGSKPIIVRRRDGIVPVCRDRNRPRMTLFETWDRSGVLAKLVCDGRATVFGTNGSRQDFARGQPISIRSDVHFKVLGPRLRPWVGAVEGSIEALGRAELHRAEISMSNGGQPLLRWDRSERPELALEPIQGIGVQVSAGLGEIVELESSSESGTWARWADQRLLVLPRHQRVPVLATHLKAISNGNQTIDTRVRGQGDVDPPRIVSVHASEAPTLKRQDGDPLFGFESVLAYVEHVGLRIDPSPSSDRLRLPLGSLSPGTEVLRLGFDSLPGVKLLPLIEDIVVEGKTASLGQWVWIAEVATLELAGRRVRLEALDPVRVTFEHPPRIAELSRDVRTAWRYGGWTIRATPSTIAVAGSGHMSLRIDGQPITNDTTIPAAPEHHIEVGSDRFRIVRPAPSK